MVYDPPVIADTITFPLRRSPPGPPEGSPGAGQGCPSPAEGRTCARGSPLGQGLQGEAEKALAEAQALKLQARLEDLTVWQMKNVKQTRKGSRTYT
ncbi:MAG: hypothetical protein NTX42_11445 [Methanothrix sp.]|nr:hypothetical protein [Methanothrix sp.]